MFVHCGDIGDGTEFMATPIFYKKDDDTYVVSITPKVGGLGNIPVSKPLYLTQEAINRIIVDDFDGMPFRAALVSKELFELRDEFLKYGDDGWLQKPLVQPKVNPGVFCCGSSKETRTFPTPLSGLLRRSETPTLEAGLNRV